LPQHLPVRRADEDVQPQQTAAQRRKVFEDETRDAAPGVNGARLSVD
jgi:hypothetical protein